MKSMILFKKHILSFGWFLWPPLASSGLLWGCSGATLGSSGLLWAALGSTGPTLGLLWPPLGSSSLLWPPLGSSGVPTGFPSFREPGPS